MFVWSMKPNRRKLVIFLLILLAAAIGISCFSCGKKGGAAQETSQKPGVSTAASTNEERIAFLKHFGWEVEEEPAEIVEVAIPAEFNDVYQNYNKIQKEQGFDLTDYRQKRVKRYTYVVTNYPNEPEEVHANLLVYEGAVIGGDICSLKLDGFMHGFLMKR